MIVEDSLDPTPVRTLVAVALAACCTSAAEAAGAAPGRPLRTVAVSSPVSEAAALERAFTEVAERVGPAVVSVVASYELVRRLSPWGDDRMMDEFFRHFFGAPQEYEHREPMMSAGSGVIVTTDGYILTNAHVIGRARDVSVKLINKKEYKAKIVGRDADTDIAVLKIDAGGSLTAAALGDSDRIRVGQWAIAVGNPFGLENTVTTGVISAKGRRLDEAQGGRAARYTSFIQTDASINRGNSGGPLLNIRGEVIGINTMIYSPSGGSVGIGFSIPINVAKSGMETLIRDGRIVRPQLGVAYRPVPAEVARKLKLPEGAGMEVSGVLKDSAAEKAGIRPGDIVLTADRKPLKESEDLQRTVQQHRVGDPLSLELHRKGRRIGVTVTLKEQAREPSEEAQAPAETEAAPGEQRTWLGMTVEELTEETARHVEARDGEGLVVTKVAPDSPAAASGVRRGDVIREIEQAPVRTLADLDQARKRTGAKDDVLLLVERQGSAMYVVVEPGKQGRGE